MKHGVAVFLSMVLLVAFVGPGFAASIEVPGTSWSLQGVGRLKVKKFQKIKGTTSGRIDFETDGRFRFVLQNLLMLSGDYECRRSRCVLTADPEALENAMFGLMGATVFGAAIRGVQPEKLKFKVKIKEKKGTVFVKVRFKVVYNSLLALQVRNPDDQEAELIDPFRSKFLFTGSNP